MSKAFSLLELIVVVLILIVISSFFISKYQFINDTSNLTKLKSDVVLIQNTIAKLKQKNILLNKSENDILLDELKVLNEKSWIKESENKYSFLFSDDKKVKFTFKDKSFICIEPNEICKELP